MADDSLDRTTRIVVLCIVVFFAFLIGLVCVVGIFQGKLDPVAMVAILSGIFTGALAALGWLRDKENDSGVKK